MIVALVDAIPAKSGRLPWSPAGKSASFHGMNKSRNESGASRSAFVLSELELRALLLNAIDNRERAMLELMAYSGLRVGEVCSLEIARVDTKGRTVQVVGKFGKLRTVPISKPTAEWLQWEIGKRTKGYVFLGTKGAAHITPRAVQFAVRKAGERIEYKQKAPTLTHLNPHTLRHTAARRMKAAGFDYEEIARILGHNDIAKVVFLYGTKTFKEIQEKAESILFKLG